MRLEDFFNQDTSPHKSKKEKSRRFHLSKKELVVIAVCATLLSAGIVFAASYVLQTSSPHSVNVANGVIPVSLSLNGTSITTLDTLTLTATISDSHGNGLVVHFYDGTTDIGQATLVSETASISISSLTEGTHTFTAGP